MTHNFITCENAAAMMMKKDINNQAEENLTNEEAISRILPSRNTLEQMLEGMHVAKKPWNVRNFKADFRNIISRAKPVKMIENLRKILLRIEIVNKNLWIICQEAAQAEPFVAVYDQGLNAINQHRWKQLPCLYACQQISATDVLIAGEEGLHIVDIKGKYQYKVMDGVFSDISQDDNNVAAIEYEQNKVIFLNNSHGRWQSQSQIVVQGRDRDEKTVQLKDNNKLFLCMTKSNKILEININSGKTEKQYGTGNEGKRVGEFDSPYLVGMDVQGHLIVNDVHNYRFQVLDSTGSWHKVKLQGVREILDAIIMENQMFVTHMKEKNKDQIGVLSKYQF